MLSGLIEYFNLHVDQNTPHPSHPMNNRCVELSTGGQIRNNQANDRSNEKKNKHIRDEKNELSKGPKMLYHFLNEA